MKIVRAVFLGATVCLSGCTTGAEIAKDLGEIVHINGAVGLGAHAHAGIGDLVHAGAGLQLCYQYGWA